MTKTLPPQEKENTLVPSFLHIFFYATLFGIFGVILEYGSIYFLQMYRHTLDQATKAALSLPSTHLSIILSAFLLGSAIGLVLGFIHYIIHRWLSFVLFRGLWLVICFATLIVLFLLHWVNNIIFDCIHAYPFLGSYSSLNFFAPKVFPIYSKMVSGESALNLLIHYYSTTHVIILLILFFLLARYKSIMPLGARFFRMHAITWGVTILVALGTLHISMTSIGPKKKRMLCTEMTLSLYLMPSCKIAPITQKQRPRNPVANKLISLYEEKYKKNRKFIPVQKYLSKVKQGPKNSPNILLIILESIGSHHIGSYGYKRRKTSPFMDSLSQKCSRFKWAFSSSNLTRLSVGSIFSGMFYIDPIYRRNPTYYPVIPELLKEAGYQNAIFSAGQIADNLHKFLRAPSWDRYLDTDDPRTYQVPPMRRCLIDCHMFRELRHWVTHKRKKDKPFFITLHPHATHFPYRIPPSWRPLFARKRLSFYTPIFYPPSEHQNVLAHYDDTVRHTDTMIKGVFEILKKQKLLKNTYVIIVADHGEEFYQHGDPSHGTNLYNSQMRVPMFLCGPKVKAKVIKKNVSHIDIAPTILAAAGLPPYPSYAGHNLLSLSSLEPNRPIFLVNHHITYGSAVIMGNYKYIYDRTRRKESLFDLRKDPNEKVNILHKHPKQVEAMRWIMLEQLKSNFAKQLWGARYYPF